MSQLRIFRDNTTGQITSCMRWEGNNLSQVKLFCKAKNVKYLQEKKELWIVIVNTPDKNGKDIPECGVLGFVDIGEWITWNGIELFPIEHSYDGHPNFTLIN